MTEGDGSGVFPWKIELEGAYGLLPRGFTFVVPLGYATLVGSNNSGKSTILQAVFARALQDGSFGGERVCFLPSERGFVPSTTEVAGLTLAQYNANLTPWIQGSPLNYQTYSGPNFVDLTRILMNESDYGAQLGVIAGFLARLGLPGFKSKRGAPHAGDQYAGVQGGGYRSALAILAALSVPELKLILIDEPEAGLEASAQKAMRNLLIDEAAKRPILVATHSHLFLDRQKPSAALVVQRDGSKVDVRTAKDAKELAEITFQRLGNSTEDLFLPANFLVVEGSSDQVLADRVLTLLAAEPGNVKVLAARGIDGLVPTLEAVERALRPIYTNDSPYAKKIVVIVDRQAERKRVKALQERLGERLVELPADSLEEYLPAELYRRVDLKKDALLREIERNRDYALTSAIKTRISNSIAAVMSHDDLDLIPELRDAVQLAMDRATSV
jgi:ABC-type multidrug transport system ATPase subunit